MVGKRNVSEGARGRYAKHQRPNPVLGIAIAALAIAVLAHVFSRRGGIVLNNTSALCKVFLLLVIIILGILQKSGLDLGRGNAQNKNFEKPFSGTSNSMANYVESLISILYSFSGFKQPFYAFGEAKTQEGCSHGQQMRQSSSNGPYSS
jgi:amino acid transporter